MSGGKSGSKTAAERQRKHRENERLGIRCYKIWLPDSNVEVALEDAGWLAHGDADNEAKVAVALQDMVERLFAPDESGGTLVPIAPRLSHVTSCEMEICYNPVLKIRGGS